MGFKPRVKPEGKPTRVRKPTLRRKRAVKSPRKPISVAALGTTPKDWHVIHHYIHEFEAVWDGLDPHGKDSFVKATALFLGGACAESHSKQLALSRAQAVVRAGFIDYPGQRNDICQAVDVAHTFERGDQTVN